LSTKQNNVKNNVLKTTRPIINIPSSQESCTTEKIQDMQYTHHISWHTHMVWWRPGSVKEVYSLSRFLAPEACTKAQIGTSSQVVENPLPWWSDTVVGKLHNSYSRVKANITDFIELIYISPVLVIWQCTTSQTRASATVSSTTYCTHICVHCSLLSFVYLLSHDLVLDFPSGNLFFLTSSSLILWNQCYVVHA
jgi:hypothetical protein